MTTLEVKRICTVKKWIKSCETDSHIDSCLDFTKRYLSANRHLMDLIILQRYIINGMDNEAIAYSRQMEGSEILSTVKGL